MLNKISRRYPMEVVFWKGFFLYILLLNTITLESKWEWELMENKGKIREGIIMKLGEFKT